MKIFAFPLNLFQPKANKMNITVVPAVCGHSKIRITAVTYCRGSHYSGIKTIIVAYNVSENVVLTNKVVFKWRGHVMQGPLYMYLGTRICHIHGMNMFATCSKNYDVILYMYDSFNDTFEFPSNVHTEIQVYCQKE